MLSKKTQYAFKALIYLAEKGAEGPVLIAEISKKKKIPLKFLENINKIVFVRDDEIYLNSLFTSNSIRNLVSDKFNLYDIDISLISNSNIIQIKNHL